MGIGMERRRRFGLTLAIFAFWVIFVVPSVKAQSDEKVPGPKAWPGQAQPVPAQAVPAQLNTDGQKATNSSGSKTDQSAPPTADGSEQNKDNVQQDAGAPLVVAGEEVLRIKVKLGGFTPERRVESIKARLTQFQSDPEFRTKLRQIRTKDTGYSTDIVSGDFVIMTVTSLDAKAAGVDSREALARDCAVRLEKALEKYSEEHSIRNKLSAISMTVAMTLALFGLLALTGWVFPRSYRLIVSWQGIHELKIQQARLISQETLTDVVIGMLRIVRVLFVLMLFSVYATLVLSFFPETRELSGVIISASFGPIQTIIFPAVIGYLPNIIFMVLISLTTYYIIAFIHFLFKEIGRGNISIDGFNPEWSESTFKIVRFLIITFAFVMIFPYLPGAGSPAFQQVSLFMGVLLSLGSTGAITNVIAGVFLTYTGAFRIGDRVKIADTVGDVMEKTLLATRIRTIKQEYITIPNALVLGSHIINYSSSVGKEGLILHTTITIGYDTPWKDVQKLLIDAALATEDVLSSPEPFVLQTALDDFYVRYQINAYTDKPHLMAVTYSNLHRNIQDKFNQAAVEIMSPQYYALRDGNQMALPENSRAPSYSPPRFGIDLKGSTDLKSKD